MQLINKTTGIVEYFGAVANFKGIDAYRHPESTAEFEIIYSQEEVKSNLRSSIYNSADIHSLLGTTADAAQVLVLFACADAVALANSTTFAAYKQARMDALTQLSGSPASAAELVSKAGQLLADVQAGTVLMPFLVKPGKAAGVFDDVATRATAVAQVLAASQA